MCEERKGGGAQNEEEEKWGDVLGMTCPSVTFLTVLSQFKFQSHYHIQNQNYWPRIANDNDSHLFGTRAIQLVWPTRTVVGVYAAAARDKS